MNFESRGQMRSETIARLRRQQATAALTILRNCRRWMERQIAAVPAQLFPGSKHVAERMRIADRLQLGAKSSLVMVTWENRRFLVSVSAGCAPQVTEISERSGIRPSSEQPSALGYQRIRVNRTAARMRSQGGR